MLLIALSRPKDGFSMPYEYVPDWYGVSSDSAEEGLRELRNAGLLIVESDWVKAPRSKIGWTEQLLYTLQGSFSKAERVKASRVRNPAPQADTEPVVAMFPPPPVLPPPLLPPPIPMPPHPTVAQFLALGQLPWGLGVITSIWSNGFPALVDHAPPLCQDHVRQLEVSGSQQRA